MGECTHYIDNNRSRRVVEGIGLILREAKVQTRHERNNIKRELNDF